METIYFTKSILNFKRILFVIVLLFGVASFAQVNPTAKDSTGYSTGRVEIQNPNSIVNAYTYDPVTNRYVYSSTFEGFNINYPIILTPKEYEELVLRESMRKYFKDKSDAIDGKKEGSEAAKKDLLPRYYVNSGFFESIFGSNTIDVKPTGSVEMDLGVRYTKQDNPSFSPRNRAQTTFDFDQRISMSLMGKVGTRLNVNINYDTESTFAFQNLIKLEYTPTEDDIIQKIEVGNVSMPLTNSLIRGAQSLFGVKAQLQFGKTTVTGVFSEQKSQTRSVNAQGGGTIQDFEMFALDYDSDRHFFLSQYFRNKYDQALRNYPFIDSRVQITRMEVWVTNRQNRVSTTNNNLRNIIALQDLGESQYTGLQDSQIVAITPVPGDFFVYDPVETPPDNDGNVPSDNKNNKYNPELITAGGGLLNSNIRDIVTSSAGFNNTVDEGTDYSKLENARKLAANEYKFHPQLGYISLQQRLANDEVLAVAYQYTIGDAVYQVGEFGTDGVDATVVEGQGTPEETVSSQNLILKMVKSNLTNVQKPIWNLMMKNIYQIQGGYQLEQADFKFNILYTDPSPLNYITPANTTSPLPSDVAETPLLKVFNVDKLNYNNDPQAGGDGFFDFMPGLTVDQENGRLIFTTIEPFGKHLFEKLRSNASEDYNGTTYNDNQTKYVFRNMYVSTQAAALQDADKNKFQLKGRYKSIGGDGIPIGAYNVPRGSVVVTAGGRVLQEGIDYSVNYQAGKVQILDPSLQASNTPIEVSVENNSTFGQQTRRYMGINVEHKFSDKFLVGGTFIKMTERPFTTKSNYGQESVNNTIFGFNSTYSAEVPFLTRLVNKLPNIDTDVPSNISLRGEIAFLKPDAPKADQFEGEATVYIDDFEGSQTTIDMRSPLSWTLSSTPKWQAGVGYDDFGSNAVDLTYGYKRSKLNWYSIDPTIYVQTPGEIGQDGISLNSTRRIYSEELFPNLDISAGQSQVINTLDLTYYPQERGPYNFNPEALNPTGFLNPEKNFGGITRAINSTNFEQSNVEYIQFWVLDPYFDPANPNAAVNPNNIGQLYFNLGEISEDILKDERKQYENGLPSNSSSQSLTNPTIWGKVPASQSLIYAFDVDGANRSSQDVGFDGVNDADESNLPNIASGFAALDDPAADNYQYFLSATGSSVFERYAKYNGLEGNSPVDVSDTNRGSTTIPDVEDINRDNTMNTVNAYYEYKIEMAPYNATVTTPNGPVTIQVGQNFITDVRVTNNINLPNGTVGSARWIQYKIPVTQPENTIGSITDFRSIRFMRMFMTGFTEPITVRFGALDLVRGEWRRYDNSFQETDADPDDDNTNFDVLAVNIQENAQRLPIPYVVPPGVIREQQNENNTIINQNEQSLSLRASGDGLEVGDSRAVFKNVSVDMRQFNKLKMFLHAEALPSPTDPTPLLDNQMVAFLRFGNDFTNNYYQVEIPLKVTAEGSTTQDVIWPEENEIDLAMSLLTRMKVQALNIDPTTLPEGVYYPDDDISLPDGDGDPRMRLGIRGNPNFGLVRTLMVGIKNNHTDKVRGEVWFNELRIADMNNEGGMAAVVNMDTNFADFATISGTGRMSTIGFGAIEEGPNERSREDLKQYNIVTNFSLGQLLPKKWGINLPFNYAVGEELITPEYDPYNQDIRLEQLIDNTTDPAERENIRDRAVDFTKRKSINFIGVKKERSEEQKQHVYDPENLTLSYSYNQVEKHNYEIENYIDQQVSATVDYTYAFKPGIVEPLKKNKYLKKSDYWKLLSDFNLSYLPASISYSSNITRQYNRQQFRQVDVAGIALDPLYRRNYMYNYQYGFNYNLSKSLRINYTAASHNIVRSYIDENNMPDNSYTLWTDFWNIGTPNQFNQQIVLNYDIPINKIPVFAFIKSTYSYTGDYSWQRASLALSSIEASDGNTYNLGNTIQNASSHRLNTAFNMDTFYKYIGLGKKPATAQPKPTAAPKPGEKVSNTKTAPAKSSNMFLDGLVGVLTSVKNIQVNYTLNQGTSLPGYLPSIGYFGTSKPTLGFVFGAQDDVRYEAAKRGWLTSYPDFNQNYTEVLTRTLELIANVDLFPDFKIDLNANRAYSESYSEQYDITDGQYNSRSPYSFGNYSISTILIKTSFSKSDENGSAAFDDFRSNRLTIADRLAEQHYGGTNIPRYGDAANPIPTDVNAPNYAFYTANAGYPIGYGKNNQAVLIPSFLAAYSGSSSDGVSLGAFRSFPLPNWTIKYTGLMRYKFFKDTFKRFSIQHGYRASYTINAFRSNFDYDQNPGGQDNSGFGNFYNQSIIANINLVEQFNPLVRFDFEMKSSLKILAEMKKDRSLSMSFDNNLLTEVQGHEYILGFGYRIKDVIFSSKLADNPTGVIKSDINIKMDFSYRNNKTIVRYLDYDNNQIGGGQDIWSAKLTADYSFSKNLTAIFFYDHSFSQPVISTSFPLTNIRTGFTMRYNFGN